MAEGNEPNKEEVIRLLVKGVLTAAHEAAGLTLEEVGDDFLFLRHGSETISAFYPLVATPEAIRQLADRWMKGGGALGDRRGTTGAVIPDDGAPAQAAGADAAGSGGPGNKVEDLRRKP